MFSDGIVIKERVAEFIPREKLTFDIVEQPTHPEAYGHITLHRGQFVLRDNGDGTTTLFGSSWSHVTRSSNLVFRSLDARHDARRASARDESCPPPGRGESGACLHGRELT